MVTSPDNKSAQRLQVIEGVLERLVFSSPTSDFVVARLKVGGRSEPVTVVGNLAGSYVGETLVLQGNWVLDKKFGEQFRFENAQTKAPSTIRGIERYLASALVKGIGPEMARRIAATFGEETLDLIENEPQRLREVAGIGPVRAERISEAFREHRSIREVMLFLQTHGISSTYAFKIFKLYGNKAVDAVTRNPYCLATDIRGIGFHSADRVAGSMGLDMRSPLRLGAGLFHVMDAVQSEGHVYYPRRSLIERARELLGTDAHAIERALEDLLDAKALVLEEDRVYTPVMASMENVVASRLRALMSSPRFLPPINMEAAFQWIERRSAMVLSTAQKLALSAVLDHKVLIITGGPGTGKTTILRALIEILEAKKLRVLLAAPTGRAAKRLSEATGREAKTVHRLLEYSPAERGFQRGVSRPLEAEVVVIDEVSMVDLSLMHSLLAAVHQQSTLLLVGDADQLPSVGPGNVLGDLIASGKVPSVRLNTVFRQARMSHIVMNAHLVNEGRMPEKGPEGEGGSDFYFIEKDDPEDVVRLIKELVGRRIPERFGFNPVEEVQVLSPMHKGTVGTENLNRELRSVLNPEGQPLKGGRFRVGDRVMQTRNNYDKDVFNGDVGRIASYDQEWDEALVDFEGHEVKYHVSELDELIPAYAATVHKAQGSEYRGVIVPLSTQHYMMLRRNLLYTAMTRGRELVVLLGSSRALRMAVENRVEEPRWTHLARKI
jgi:exodeoxyribonuclease V alpha subunit